MLVGGKFTALPLPFNDCVVPNDINGPVAIFITSDNQPLVNNVRDRDTVKLVAGPTLAFIDIAPQTIGQLARGSSAVVTSTTTISPDQASTILSGATATASAPSPSGTGSAGPVPLAATANQAKGESKDKAIIVLGWSNVA